MDRRQLCVGSALGLIAPTALKAQTPAAPAGLPLRVLVFQRYTMGLAEPLAQALRATGRGMVTVDLVDVNLDEGQLRGHLAQWLAAVGASASLVVLPSDIWLGLGALRPHLGIPPEALVPVGGLSTQTALVAVHPALPVHDAQALADLLRARPHRYPAHVQSWCSPAHWLAMLWVQAANVPLRWQFPAGPPVPDEQLARSGRAAIVFGSETGLLMRTPRPQWMPVAAWSDGAPRHAIDAAVLQAPAWPLPPPPFTAALTSQAWAAAQPEAYAVLQQWFAAALKTEPLARSTAGLSAKAWPAPAETVLAAAQAQRRAFQAAMALQLEGGRS